MNYPSAPAWVRGRCTELPSADHLRILAPLDQGPIQRAAEDVSSPSRVVRDGSQHETSRARRASRRRNGTRLSRRRAGICRRLRRKLALHAHALCLAPVGQRQVRAERAAAAQQSDPGRDGGLQRPAGVGPVQAQLRADGNGSGAQGQLERVERSHCAQPLRSRREGQDRHRSGRDSSRSPSTPDRRSACSTMCGRSTAATPSSTAPM